MATQTDASQGSMAVGRGLVRDENAPFDISRRMRPGELFIRGLLLFCGVISIFTTIGIVWVLLGDSLQFFDSRAWVRPTTFIVEENARFATLDEPVDEGETTLSISWEGQDDGERIPFINRQYVQFGEEIMQVTSRGQRTITVARGQRGTEAIAHNVDQQIFSMSSTQIRPTSIEDTSIALSGNYELSTGDLVRVGEDSAEIMRVIAVQDGAILAERGVGSLLSEDELARIEEEAPAIIERIRAEQAALQEHTLIQPGDAEISPTLITLPEEFIAEFEAGDTIRVGPEASESLRVSEVTAEGLLVERGFEATIPQTYHTENGRYPAILIPEEVTLTEFVSNTTWQPQAGEFGIWALLTATLIISVIALLVAVPLGLGAAIYLSEYANPHVRGILKPMLEILAGIPTVVFGFFALTFVSPTLRNIFGPAVQGQNMLAAGIVVGILIIPYMSAFSEDALSSVPRALREASYGLGATKLETTVKVVLPAAISGILAALILSISRAVGETMIVAIAAGSGPNFTFNVFAGAETMTGHIARISGGDLSFNSIDYNSIFAIGLVLFLVTLVLNLISNYVTNRFREAY